MNLAKSFGHVTIDTNNKRNTGHARHRAADAAGVSHSHQQCCDHAHEADFQKHGTLGKGLKDAAFRIHNH